MARKVYVNVYDDVERATVAENVTLQEAADIVGVKYCSLVGKVNDRRRIKGKYVLTTVVSTGNDSTPNGERPMYEWVNEWNLIREGVRLLKSGKGYIKTFPSGRKAVVPYHK